MKKTAFIIVLITIVSKMFGFFREIVLSYFYGAGTISDAYLISYTVPGLIFSFIGVGIATSFIPIYSNVEKTDGTSDADTFTSNLLLILLGISSVLVLLMFIFTSPIVKVFALGFDKETLDLAITFTRISMFSIFLSIAFHLLSSYLNVKGNYHVPALAGIPNNIITVISIWLSSIFGVVLLPLGIVASLVVQIIPVAFVSRKYNFRFIAKANQVVLEKNLRKIFYLSIPVVLGVSVNQINVLVDRTLASTISVGGISALSYASRLNTFVQEIFVITIATIMYPLISKLVVAGNIEGVRGMVSKVVTAINVMIVPIMIISMLFAHQIINLVFGRGAFDSSAMSMTTSALFFYSLGMVAFGLREVISRFFYASQDTKTPMLNAAIGMVINIVLNLILSRYLGIGGLALATSIAALFTTVLLFISLRRKTGPFGMKKISISFFKILFASLIMGAVAKLSFSYLEKALPETFSFLVATGIGGIFYILIIASMKIKDIDIFVEEVKKKLLRKKSNIIQ